MPIFTLSQITDMLRCPCCASRVENRASGLYCTGTDCEYARSPYMSVGGQPVLVDFGTSVFKRATYASGNVPITRPLA